MKAGTFFKTIKDAWDQLIEGLKNINWEAFGTKNEGFIKTHPWVVMLIIVFLVLVLVFIIIITTIRKSEKELEDSEYDSEYDKLVKEIMERDDKKEETKEEEIIETKTKTDDYEAFLEDLDNKNETDDTLNEYKSLLQSLEKEEEKEEKEKVEYVEDKDINFENVLEKLLEKKKKEIWDAVVVNKQQEAIIARDSRIESLLMDLLDIKNNGINSNIAREILGEKPATNNMVEPNIVKVNEVKPDVIMPKIEINIPGLIVQTENKKVESREPIRVENAEPKNVEPKYEEPPIIPEPKIYQRPVNLNPINLEKIEVVQVSPGKKYGVDNTNTNRAGIVFTDDEIRNTIKD